MQWSGTICVIFLTADCLVGFNFTTFTSGNSYIIDYPYLLNLFSLMLRIFKWLHLWYTHSVSGMLYTLMRFVTYKAL